MATDTSRFYPPADMSWSERRAADQRHFAATKAAATERIVHPAPAEKPLTFHQAQRSLSRVLTAAGEPHTVCDTVIRGREEDK